MAQGVTLSGYLPGEDRQGLTDLGDGLVSQHKKRKRPADIPVVGLLRTHTVKDYVDTDAEPQVTVRFVALEPIQLNTAEAEQVAELIDRLREARTGNALLPVDGGEPGPLPGD